MTESYEFSVDQEAIQNILGNTQTERIPNDDLIIDYFSRPTDYQKIFNNIPAVLDGVRGTGKSMYLRYFQIGNQLKLINQDMSLRIFPVYFKINDQFFIHFHSKNFKDINRFAEVLRHYFNLNIVLLVLNLLLKNKKVMKGRSRFKTVLKNFLLKNRIIPSEAESASRNLKAFKNFCENTRYNLIESLREWRLEGEKYDKCFTFFEDVDFIFEFFELIKILFFGKEPTKLFILLDEYDKLNEKQQSVINSLVKERNTNVTFKLACKTGNFHNRCFPNQSIDTIHDISWHTINQTFFSRNISEFKKYVEDIVNKRFMSLDERFSINKILGKSESIKNRLTKIKETKKRGGLKLSYFGATDVVRVSAGVVRYYMDLCNQILSEGATNGSIKSIPHQLQNNAIISYSQRQQRYAQNSVHGEEFLKLITALTHLFRYRSLQDYVHSSTLSFNIRNLVNLNKESKMLIKNAESEGIIIRFARQEPDGHSTQMAYGLNAVYAPAYNLLPIYPDAVQISADAFDLILDSQNEFYKRMRISPQPLQLPKIQNLDKFFPDPNQNDDVSS